MEASIVCSDGKTQHSTEKTLRIRNP